MKTAMLGLHTETSLHAGAGSALEVIDLPIQREAHTQWPCVFGSAVKGALRSCAESQKISKLTLVFGPPMGTTGEHAGALLVGDARLALLPVRSLTGHFKWVCCPALLGRLKRDAERLGLPGFDFKLPDVPTPETDGADPIALACQPQENLYLEEYRYQVQDADLEGVVQALAQLSGVEGFEDDLRRQLLIVGNDDFTFFARHATPVTPHIALDSATKTTRSGALWYEESLPPETLLYVCLIAHDARNALRNNEEGIKEERMREDKVMATAKNLFKDKPYLQLGGNETVGMGWCKTKWVPVEAEDVQKNR
jgi:CRISPR-associated protein Cmr4